MENIMNWRTIELEMVLTEYEINIKINDSSEKQTQTLKLIIGWERKKESHKNSISGIKISIEHEQKSDKNTDPSMNKKT